MVRNFHIRKRKISRINNHFCKKQIPDKVVVEKSKISYAQYFIIPSIFTFIGLQYFKQSNFNPTFLLLILFGVVFSFGLNIFLRRKFRKNPEIVLNKKGITFSNSRTIFWNEIEFYHLRHKNLILRIFVKCKNEDFLLEFKDLPISKVKLKVLFNSFYRKYNSQKPAYKPIINDVLEMSYVKTDSYLDNTIL
ncbi:hypothetical protein [Chryseobacterium echinoideorum]|uniref:hypothetical protein n=1 Tax=Chryseobacterium echinoideorum TaxID=1549648 RepID=UPI00118596BC|nr:hypothetical protein [Chryseobacterium echinoideorum]